LLTIPLPDELNTLAADPIALVANGPQAELGQAFVDLVLSPSGQAILGKWNFTPASPAALVPVPTTDRLFLVPAPPTERLALVQSGL
jgi:ABC-type Fe3+ transport system substrate-binding protein